MTYKGREYDVMILGEYITLQAHATAPDFADGHDIILDGTFTSACRFCADSEMLHALTQKQIENYFRKEEGDISEYVLTELEAGRALVDYGDGDLKTLETLNEVEL